MTSPTNIRVGGEVDAHCNKCELNLAHTIIAMVGPKIAKVECLTCHNVHAYKGVQPLVAAQGFGRKRTSRPKAAKAEKVIISWETQLKDKDVAKAKKYSARATFAVDDVVDHPTFGLGFVTAVRGPKIDVSFKAEQKTLVHVPVPTIQAQLKVPPKVVQKGPAPVPTKVPPVMTPSEAAALANEKVAAPAEPAVETTAEPAADESVEAAAEAAVEAAATEQATEPEATAQEAEEASETAAPPADEPKAAAEASTDPAAAQE